MTTWTDIDQMIYEMVRDRQDPGGIIGTPQQIKRLMAQRHDSLYHDPRNDGSGWTYQGLPIFRSYEVSGPCVVSREVLKAMRKFGRVAYPDADSALATTLALPTENPILF